jgi:hypothetical protein
MGAWVSESHVRAFAGMVRGVTVGLSVAFISACSGEEVTPEPADDEVEIGRVGVAGGTLSHQLGDRSVRLSVPPGAVREDTIVTASLLEARALGAPCGVWSLGPSGLHFDKPVGLVFRCAPGDLPIVDNVELRAATRVAGVWQTLPATPVEHGAIGGLTEHFSEFGVVIAGTSEPLHLGETTGTHFELGGVRIEAAAPFHLLGMTLGGGWVSYLAEGAPGESVELTASGLLPRTLAHVIDNGLNQSTAIETDDAGSLSYTQPLGGKHAVFIQT